jgi:hypothetical protein
MTKTTATQRTKPASPTDAIALLESDHREVEIAVQEIRKGARRSSQIGSRQGGL